MAVRLSGNYTNGIPGLREAGIREFNYLLSHLTPAMFMAINKSDGWLVLRRTSEGHYPVYIYANKPKVKAGIIRAEKISYK